MRIPCSKCGAEILETTAKANGGICAPCARGAGLCMVCNKRVWEANRAGEYVHVECAIHEHNESAMAATGLDWESVDDIDWKKIESVILKATLSSFQQIAKLNPSKQIQDVVVAYRVSEGIIVEPCVTFDDGTYVNTATDNEQLLSDLEAYNYGIQRISNDLADKELEDFIEKTGHCATRMMNKVFLRLEDARFGMNLTNHFTKTLKEF